MDKPSRHFTVQELFKGEGEHEEIDSLNDETFGDSAVDNDWESFHFASVGENFKEKDVDTKDAHDVTSKFNDFTLKELWGNTNSTDNSTIWGSADIPLHKPVLSKVITLEDLERDLLVTSTSPSSPPTSTPHNNIPPHILRSPLSQSPPSYPPHPRGVFMRHPITPYMSHGYPVPGLRPPLLQQPMPRPYMIPPRGPPFRMPPNVPIIGPPPVISGMHVRHYGRPQFQPVNMPPRPHFNPAHQQMAPPPFLPSKLSELLCEVKPDGSGFMTTKEKEWIIKVQLLQLHTVSPDIDDYYYQRYMQKKISQRDLEEGVVSSNEIMSSMSLPPPVDQTKKRGRVEFEKTLGKVSTGSVAAPRKTIDVAPPTSDVAPPTSDSKERSSNSRKRLVLLTIEEIFNILLKLDDILETTSGDLVDSKDRQIKELVDNIFYLTKLNNHDGGMFFQQMLHYKKGKNAFQKFLPHLSKEQAKLALTCFNKNIVNIVRKDNVDKVLPGMLPSINGVIIILSVSEIVQYVTSIISVINQKLTDNQFFINYLILLVKQGNSLALEESINKDWLFIIQQLLNSLSQFKKSSLLTELISLLATPLPVSN